MDEWTSSADIYLKGGKCPKAGDFFTNSVMADMYQRIIDEAEAKSTDRNGQIQAAREIWRKGFVAKAIDKFSKNTIAMDTSGERHGGLLRYDDMANWSATIAPP